MIAPSAIVSISTWSPSAAKQRMPRSSSTPSACQHPRKGCQPMRVFTAWASAPPGTAASATAAPIAASAPMLVFLLAMFIPFLL